MVLIQLTSPSLVAISPRMEAVISTILLHKKLQLQLQEIEGGGLGSQIGATAEGNG